VKKYGNPQVAEGDTTSRRDLAVMIKNITENLANSLNTLRIGENMVYNEIKQYCRKKYN
jgi:hypothetical protein